MYSNKISLAQVEFESNKNIDKYKKKRAHNHISRINNGEDKIKKLKD